MGMDYESMSLAELVDDLFDEVNSEYFSFRNLQEESKRLNPLLDTIVYRYTDAFPELFMDKSRKKKRYRAPSVENRQTQKAEKLSQEHEELRRFIRKYYGSDADHVEFLGMNGVEVTSKKGEISTFVLIGDKTVRSGTGRVIQF